MLTIGIAGGTGSGKTTVAKAILEQLGPDHVTLISQDAYYHDHPELPFSRREQLNYDHPDSFDNDLLRNHLRDLQNGRSVEMPIYDFKKHGRSNHTIHVAVRPVVILEGIHVLVDAELRKLLDIKVFVDTDPDVRVLRRIRRDIEDRGRTIESVYEQYLTTVKPMHDAFIEPSKRFADLIIPEGGENEIAIALLTTRVSQFLTEFSRTRGLES
ncbi:uridine kinase [Alicyclobacillus dauci]|uniref:Uridine kinase n=1 Tax=Alicyclobacillus dauci TaxID=1475485 RepID=A0ABY6Z952_9BACL|nr:uridine kinase [Alicyclobacillus dauci]WAH39324.1 uridine kinase [Alicyclobacillus dauci]